MSAAPGRADRQRVLGPADGLVGGQRHVHPAAQLGQLRQGARTAARRTPGRTGPAWPASAPRGPRPRRRWRPPGPARPGRARPAPPRPWRCPSASDCPASATLTFAVRQPEPVTIARACSGPTAGTVTLTGTLLRTGAGQPTAAASSAQASQRAHSRGPYSANGENSPQPAGPSIRAPSRTVMPRNRLRIGIANARSGRQRGHELLAQVRRGQPGPAGRARRPPAILPRLLTRA